MKNWILISVSLLFVILTMSFDKKGEVNNYYFAKSDLELVMKDLHKAKENDLISKGTYDSYVLKCDKVIGHVNSTLLEISSKIVQKYGIFKGESIKQKHENIRNKLVKAEKEAQDLTASIEEFLDSVRNQKKYAKRRADLTTATFFAIVTIAAIVEKKIRNRACVKAGQFYELNRWFTMEELISKKRNNLDWEFLLDKKCAKAIRESEETEDLKLEDILSDITKK